MEMNWWEGGSDGDGCVGDGRNGVGGSSGDLWRKLTEVGDGEWGGEVFRWFRLEGEDGL
jgi:hypothetical protein